jgi:hypothetical protein
MAMMPLWVWNCAVRGFLESKVSLRCDSVEGREDVLLQSVFILYCTEKGDYIMQTWKVDTTGSKGQLPTLHYNKSYGTIPSQRQKIDVKVFNLNSVDPYTTSAD